MLGSLHVPIHLLHILGGKFVKKQDKWLAQGQPTNQPPSGRGRIQTRATNFPYLELKFVFTALVHIKNIF